MKNMTQMNGVTLARPSVKSRFTTNPPDWCSSAPTDISSKGPLFGAILDRYRATLSRFPPLRTRKRIDSGSRTIERTPITTGRIPPTINTDCQPNCEISPAATKPPTAAPMEKPVNIVMTAVARNFLGAYSEVRAMALGIAPPKPNPVNRRKKSKDSSEPAVAVRSAPKPNIHVQRTKTGLRPNRSASGPQTSAPIIIPNSPLEMTGPRRERSLFQLHTNYKRKQVNQFVGHGFRG